MARTPNYSFERKERERLKAEKKAKRTADKKAARESQTDPLDLSNQSDTENPADPTSE
jgi:hypothetical protein